MADEGERTIDLSLLGRYAAFVGLTVWIPLPLVDRLIANRIRRASVRTIASAHGVTLDEADVITLSDFSGGGCMGCLWSVVIWPVKKLIKWVFTFLQVKEMVDVGVELAHRGLLLEEALRQGWLPGDAERVRAAMDATLAKVEVRPVERAVRGAFRGAAANDWKALVDAATTRDRDRFGQPGVDPDPVVETALSNKAFAAELVHGFRAEMGQQPRLEHEVGGVVEPELMPPDDALVAPEQPPSIEDAHEIAQLPDKRREDPE